MRVCGAELAEQAGIDFDDVSIAAGNHGRGSWFAGQQRHLAEIPSRMDRGDFLPVRLESDDRGATSDHEHRIAGTPLPDDRLAVPEHLVDRRGGDLVPLLFRQPGKEVDPGEEPVTVT